MSKILKIKPSTQYKGNWEPEDPDQLKVFQHFVGGQGNVPLIAMAESKIPELIEVAELHGWSIVQGDPLPKTEDDRNFANSMEKVAKEKKQEQESKEIKEEKSI